MGLILLLCISPSAMAQAQSGRPLDDELLKNLKAQSKTDIERELLGTGEKKANLQTGAGQGAADLNRRPRAQLAQQPKKKTITRSSTSPIICSKSKKRIAQSDAGPATLNLQKQVVADLDLLINQACKSAGQCSSNSSNSQKSAQNSAASRSKPGSKPGAKTRQQAGRRKLPAAARRPVG